MMLQVHQSGIGQPSQKPQMTMLSASSIQWEHATKLNK